MVVAIRLHSRFNQDILIINKVTSILLKFIQVLILSSTTVTENGRTYCTYVYMYISQSINDTVGSALSATNLV